MTDPRVEHLASDLEAIAEGRDRSFPRTDLGNAERLVAAHGRDLRFAQSLGWHVWDGRRWRPDRDGGVMRRAKLTARSIYNEAAKTDDDDERGKLGKHAQASEAEARLRAAVSLAESEVRVIVPPDELDSDAFLLNVENGTIDLRTGELREHRREDLLTKLAPVVYRQEVDQGEWLRFLARVTDADEELHGFLRRAAGYTLTGDTSEEVLFFAHGPTATGKTTFLEAFRSMLGDYGASADFETFLSRRGDSGPRSDVARLVGARLVVGVEVEEGKRLAEGLLKLLTGGDTVTARFMYRDFFEYRPQLKLWLAANHRPRVSAEDEAIWRRIVQVPFTEVIPEAERDPEVKRRLREDPDPRSAVLAWAVEGCLEWQREGLKVPARVRDYTAEYRAENDPVAEWLQACCLQSSGAITAARDLHASYCAWAEENGEQKLSTKLLGQALKNRGFEQKPTRSRRCWQGIALKGDAMTDVTGPSEKSLIRETKGGFTENRVTSRHPSPTSGDDKAGKTSPRPARRSEVIGRGKADEHREQRITREYAEAIEARKKTGSDA